MSVVGLEETSKNHPMTGWEIVLMQRKKHMQNENMRDMAYL